MVIQDPKNFQYFGPTVIENNNENLKECSEFLKILKKGDDKYRAHAASRLGNLKVS